MPQARRFALVAVIAGLGACVRAPKPAAPSPRPVVSETAAPDADILTIGPLQFRVHTSRTAELFHTVDQMSQWSVFSHESYLAWSTALTAEESAALAEHAKMRAARGWGNGFEQAFYVATELPRAAREAIAAGLLEKNEAEAERRILTVFLPRLGPRLDAQRDAVEHFHDVLHSKGPELGPTLRKLAVIFDVHDLPPIETFLVAGPEKSGGGGFNGGRFVVEVGPKYVPLGTFLHEASHVIGRARSAELTKSATTCGDGLDAETLGEGIAYAIAPGLVHPSDKTDPLARTVADFDAKSTPNIDAYARFNRLALELRPILKDALDDGAKLDDFLTQVCEAWRRVHARW
jgi:hypothetical protein